MKETGQTPGGHPVGAEKWMICGSLHSQYCCSDDTSPIAGVKSWNSLQPQRVYEGGQGFPPSQRLSVSHRGT